MYKVGDIVYFVKSNHGWNNKYMTAQQLIRDIYPAKSVSHQTAVVTHVLNFGYSFDKDYQWNLYLISMKIKMKCDLVNIKKEHRITDEEVNVIIFANEDELYSSKEEYEKIYKKRMNYIEKKG